MRPWAGGWSADCCWQPSPRWCSFRQYFLCSTRGAAGQRCHVRSPRGQSMLEEGSDNVPYETPEALVLRQPPENQPPVKRRSKVGVLMAVATIVLLGVGIYAGIRNRV